MRRSVPKPVRKDIEAQQRGYVSVLEEFKREIVALESRVHRLRGRSPGMIDAEQRMLMRLSLR